MEKQFIVSEKTLQAVLDYLAAQPYREVFQLIAEIQTVKPIQQEEKK